MAQIRADFPFFLLLGSGLFLHKDDNVKMCLCGLPYYEPDEVIIKHIMYTNLDDDDDDDRGVDKFFRTLTKLASS
jgi:hypothetical protein